MNKSGTKKNKEQDFLFNVYYCVQSHCTLEYISTLIIFWEAWRARSIFLSFFYRFFLFLKIQIITDLEGHI